MRNRLRGRKQASSEGEKRAVGSALISLGPALWQDALRHIDAYPDGDNPPLGPHADPRRQYSNWDWDGFFNVGLSSTIGRRTYRASRSKLSLVQLNCGAVRKWPKTTAKSTLLGGVCGHKKPHLASRPVEGLYSTFFDSGRLALLGQSILFIADRDENPHSFRRVAKRLSALRKVVNRVVFDGKRPLDKPLLGAGENLQQ
jgi:hypothetical protein